MTSIQYESREADEKKREMEIPDLISRIEDLMEYETAGDPMSGLKWTRKTTEKISEELCSSGIDVCPTTVGKLLKKLGFSLKTNVKNISSGGKVFKKADREKRNSQFEYIEELRGKFEAQRFLSISCDTKKKELIGAFKNSGTRMRLNSDFVNDHDFASYAVGKAAPYGIYDLSRNEGFVSVGKFPRSKDGSGFQSGDTPEFAVESIERWYLSKGIKRTCKKLLVLVDNGGSNGGKSHMWKIWIQRILCDKHGLEVTVCHYPPGTSKWNPVEHRLFSEISKNWKGVPLTDYETVLKYIRSTKTKSGMTVDAVLVEKKYEKGLKATKEEIKNLRIKKHECNGSWNYTIYPNKSR